MRGMNRLITLASIALVCALSVKLTATPTANRVSSSGQEIAAGAGKAIVLDTCAASCHGADKFASEHRAKSQWVETIETMKSQGAEGTEADFKSILGYLVAHNGIQIKINTATAKQIDDAMDLEPGQADAIVKYRDEHGKFADWQALMSVPGLDAKKLEEQRPKVLYE
jgi:competence ComEA-like helix-hairpin-helix protein